MHLQLTPLRLPPYQSTMAHQALGIYQELLQQEDPDPLYHTYSASCYFYMGLTQQAEEAVQQVGEHARVAASNICADVLPLTRAPTQAHCESMCVIPTLRRAPGARWQRESCSTARTRAVTRTP